MGYFDKDIETDEMVLFKNEYIIRSIKQDYSDYRTYGKPIEPFIHIIARIPFTDKDGIYHQEQFTFFYDSVGCFREYKMKYCDVEDAKKEFEQEYGVRLVDFTRKQWEARMKENEKEKKKQTIK